MFCNALQDYLQVSPEILVQRYAADAHAVSVLHNSLRAPTAASCMAKVIAVGMQLDLPILAMALKAASLQRHLMPEVHDLALHG